MTNHFTSLFNTPPPYIVGVLNITPDSFSDGGNYLHVRDAIKKGEDLIADGAHILELGGEATGPGSHAVSEDDELKRVLPVLEALSKKIFVSVDTFRSKTAKRCLEAGARMINDVSALRFDTKMPGVIADKGAHVVLMYSKEEGSSPHVSSRSIEYKDIIKEIAQFLNERIAYAESVGIPKENIIADPGMGQFLSPRSEDSWELLRRYDELTKLLPGVALQVATSRKGFFNVPLNERDPLSQLTALLAVNKGAAFIRTHNVRMMQQFLKVHQLVTQ